MRLRTAAAAFVLMTMLVGCGSDGEPAATPAQDTTTATAAPTTDVNDRGVGERLYQATSLHLPTHPRHPLITAPS